MAEPISITGMPAMVRLVGAALVLGRLVAGRRARESALGLLSWW